MPRPPLTIDWQDVVRDQGESSRTSGTRDRLRWILGFFAAALAVVLLRAVQLELFDGAEHRRLAALPREKVESLPAARGRIVARDGTVLAEDRPARALAVHYRYLETPPDARWLRRLARERLTRSARRDPRQVAAAEQTVLRERADLHRRLAALCNVSDAEWQRRTARINRRVARLADNVNRRRRQQYDQRRAESSDEAIGPWAILAGLFAPPAPLPPSEIVVAEQTDYHRVVDDVPVEVAEMIASAADAFPGVRVVEYTRRAYPRGSLAANLLGHVGSAEAIERTADERANEGDASDPDALIGRLGFEAALEATLRGTPGRARHYVDRRGDPLSTHIESTPQAGRDVVLTLDPRLQHFAEQLLDRFARQAQGSTSGKQRTAGGGAIVVLDVHSGEVLVAASEPRFLPGWFATGDARVEAVLADPRQPLFDRATRMAIAPGSAFKPLTAVALLARGVVSPEELFECQGFLDDPSAMRCQIFRQQGIGHGEITLADALARSCNVYFFHHVGRLGGESLLSWAAGFGFGRPATGDVPDAATGALPNPTELEDLGSLRNFAIGQGTLTATPLQLARLYAAIANGGHPVEARFMLTSVAPGTPRDAGGPEEMSAATRIAGLDPIVLDAVRAGLRRVVDDPSGTAYRTVRLPWLPIAGKTGTAETGGGQRDHAWFAGYAPADAPRFAFVVALEHGGSGSDAAGPLARDLMVRMRQLGYFPAALTAEKALPPGKG